MQYGTYVREVVDSANSDQGLASATALETAAGAIAASIKTAREPMTVERIGFMPTVEFDYDTQTTEGILTLYKYPGGDDSAKVALATIDLEDDAAVGYHYVVDVDNQPVAATSPYTGITRKGIADLDVGDKVAIWITTQAAGGGSIAGDFIPYFCWRTRAESEENMDYLVNRTPEKTAANSNIAS